MARPTKLTKALIAKAKKYNYVDDGDAIPTVEGFALYLGINRDTVYSWRELPQAKGDALQVALAEFLEKQKLHQEFSDIVNDLLASQSRLLIHNGLVGNFNANITKLILSGKHGYVEQTKQDLTTNGKDLPTPILGGVSVHSDDSN
jgi:hypothetical protein